MRRVETEDLLFISKSKKERIDLLGKGEHLYTVTGYSINELCEKAARDRLKLARNILNHASTCFSLDAPPFRTIISRSYYAMYHSVRAMSFYLHRGDDHQEHSKLHEGIPKNFPNHSHWENKLKNARYERNVADYDPYPRDESKFAERAAVVFQDAKALLPAVRRYLQSRGWTP